MSEILRFALRRFLTRAFWCMVMTTFLGILMFDQRATFKDQIFQDAVNHLKGPRP